MKKVLFFVFCAQSAWGMMRDVQPDVEKPQTIETLRAEVDDLVRTKLMPAGNKIRTLQALFREVQKQYPEKQPPPFLIDVKTRLEGAARLFNYLMIAARDRQGGEVPAAYEAVERLDLKNFKAILVKGLEDTDTSAFDPREKLLHEIETIRRPLEHPEAGQVAGDDSEEEF